MGWSWSFTTVSAVYLNFLLCAQVAKHQMYHKQINLSQSWRIGSKSGRKNRKRMNQKTCQEHQLISLFTPSHLDFLPHKCSRLPYYHHHQGGTLIYQELTGAKDRGRAVSPWEASQATASAPSHLCYPGNPGSVLVPQYKSCKIAVFVWDKNTILKFVGNTK